jgi:Third Longin domain of FUZ, MON1 and HPS1
MQSAVFSIVFPNFEYKCHPNHLYAPTAHDLSITLTEILSDNYQIWKMVDFSRAHLVDGHISLMWKDTTFNYAYFLWFEDSSVSLLLDTESLIYNHGILNDRVLQ